MAAFVDGMVQTLEAHALAVVTSLETDVLMVSLYQLLISALFHMINCFLVTVLLSMESQIYQMTLLEVPFQEHVQQTEE